MPLSPQAIAGALGGRVRRDRMGAHIVAPGPGCKRKDRSLKVWINPGDHIGVASFSTRYTGMDGKRYVEKALGIEWRPEKAKKKAPKQPPLEVRRAFVGEHLKLIAYRGGCTAEQMNWFGQWPPAPRRC